MVMMRFSSFGLASLAAIVGLVAPASRAATLTMGEPRDAFDVTVVANGLSQPTDVAELPDGRVVITQRQGDVLVVEADGTTQTEAGHITVNPDFGEQGLVGVVADPNFASNNTLYFWASVGNDSANKHKVYKITLGANSMLDAGRNTIISMGLRSSVGDSPAGFGNHAGGGLVIHNNLLYVAVGDTGHNATPPTNRLGTCLNSPSGKILRVDLNGGIPMDNPLVGETMVTGCTAWNQNLTMQPPDTRIFAWGFRNPYRFWIDPMTQRMWVGDVGETTREEIAVGAPIDAAGGDGQHYGWPFREGTTNYTTQQQSWQPANACMGTTPARECVPAVYDYGHSMNNNCVIGGLIPSGCGWEAPWTSKYIFGDNGSGRVWTLDVNPARDGVVANSVADFASTQGIGSFRMGAKGALYLAEVSGGLVSKVTPKGLNPATCGGAGMGGMGGMGAGGADTGGMAGNGGTMGGATAGGASGSGGAAGGAAQGGSGGTAGTNPTGAGGMAAGTGGTGGATAGSGTGGSSGGMMGTGGSATGGTGTGGTGTGGTGTGGTATTGGTGAAGAAPPEEKGGCGCRVAGGGTSYGALLAGVGALALLGLRRARQQRGKLSRKP
jgi:MYXO-CTERM domain-containing protein